MDGAMMDKLEHLSDNAAYSVFEGLPTWLTENMSEDERIALHVALNDAVLAVLKDVVETDDD